MYSRKEYIENLEAVSGIKTITTIYQEIATIRMNQIKEKVLQTGVFLEGVSQVYDHAKKAYIATLQGSALQGRPDWRQSKFIKRNGKTLLIFLSANEHLYGSLIFDVYKQFKDDLMRSDNEAVVIGTFGKYLVKNEERLENRINFFDLYDDNPTDTQIKKIVQYISNFEQIFVYHGKLLSLLKQVSTRSQISGGATLEERITAPKSYLFEPSPEEIMGFFETEIIAALFNQKIYEHLLAKLAARVLSMDQANGNADEYLKDLERNYKNFKNHLANHKQLETFAGFNNWQHLKKGGRNG